MVLGSMLHPLGEAWKPNQFFKISKINIQVVHPFMMSYMTTFEKLKSILGIIKQEIIPKSLIEKVLIILHRWSS